MSSPTGTASTYALETGAADRERLGLLNRYYNPGSERFLRTLGIARARRVLEVGCGQGQMAHFIAGELGPKGRVVGVDVSEAQLSVARESCPWPERCTFVCVAGDALEGSLGTFDVVYARFVLQHVSSPEAVLRAMLGVLAPGGLLVVEDALVEAFRIVPELDTIPGADRWWFELAARKGASPRFPERMPLAVEALGLAVERFESHQPVSFERDALRLHLLGLQQTYPALTAYGIATREQTEQHLRLLTDALDATARYVELYRVLQVAARKPSRG